MNQLDDNAARRSNRSCLAIVLAAGEGTRMRSAQPKVLHEIAGRSMLAHVLAAVGAAGAGRVAVVIGPDRDDVAREAREVSPGAEVFVQQERLGTAHAVLAAESALRQGAEDVVVAFADTPLVEAATFAKLREPLADGVGIAVLGFEARDPTGYGRLIMEGDRLVAIREEQDATDAERRIRLCNAGLMALSGEIALEALRRIGNDNAKGEYYLTDAVATVIAMGGKAVAVTASEDEVQGVNDRAQLAAAERVMQERLRRAAMAAGATLIAPETVFFSHDTAIGRDVLIEPNVVFGPRRHDRGRRRHPRLLASRGRAYRRAAHRRAVRAAAARGAISAPSAQVGNFVEIKNAELGAGAKVNHLTYIGDATVGASANIGAGTITCNYDGFGKHRTVIGEGAFIGSNSSLVAPVTIGDGAYVGSGSVITDDVPADALALGRGRQAVKEGWAAEFRKRAGAAKPK